MLHAIHANSRPLNTKLHVTNCAFTCRVLEPQILGDFCKVLVKLGISFAAVAHMEDNHQVDIVLDSTAHLAGQVLRMAPKDIKDTVSLDLLKVIPVA